LAPDHVNAIGVKYEEHALFPSDVESKTRKTLHVFFPTKPWSDNKDVQAREQSGELGAQCFWRPALGSMYEI